MLEKLMRSKAEVKILGVVLFTEGLHLREISRRAGVSAYEAKRELENLEGLGALSSERRGNQLVFRTNEGCPFLQDLKNLYRKTEGVFPKLKKALEKLKGVQYAFVFGSTAKGKETPRSDIDLMVVGDMDEDALAERIFKIQKNIGREINFIFWTPADLEEKARSGSSFLKTLLKNKRIWLVGDEDEFVRIAEKGFGKKG